MSRCIAAIGRALRPLRRVYLRRRIASAEVDVRVHEHHAKREPVLAAIARAHVAELRAELASLTPSKGSK